MIFDHFFMKTIGFGLGINFLKLRGYLEVEIQFLRWTLNLSWDWRD